MLATYKLIAVQSRQTKTICEASAVKRAIGYSNVVEKDLSKVIIRQIVNLRANVLEALVCWCEEQKVL